MINPSAGFILVLFTLTVLLTAGLLLFALWTGYRKTSFILISAAVLAVWMFFQGFLASAGFYQTNDGLPRFALALGPALLLIIAAFLFRSSRNFLTDISLAALTLISVVRIPVEFTIDWWFKQGLVPQLMTFEGRNFDIISGITAPIVFFFVFYNPSSSLERGKKVILISWNIICLLLLINVVTSAILSVPGPLQTLAFDQPAVAVLQFPFIWLPSVIVPAVLFSHVVSLYHLIVNPD